jgi:hypothetical protein
MRALLLLALLPTLGGCPAGAPPPCALDRLECEPPPEFPRLESCDATGDLEVELGEGHGEFEPLADGEAPTLHFGAQGGQHVTLGVRVKGARLDLYDRLRFTFWAGQGEACAPGPLSEAGQPPEGCGYPLAVRELVLGGEGDFALRVNGGVVEEYDLVLILDYPAPETKTVVHVGVEDPCGRAGADAHTWTAP